MRGAFSWRAPEGRGRDQRELDAGGAHAHAVAGAHRGALAHARAVDPGAVAAVVDEDGALAFTTQRAVAPRDAGRRARQRDVWRVGNFLGADDQARLGETHRVAAVED